MNLHLVDLIIICTYLVAMIGIGFWMRKRAGATKESYLLGGKTMPWYFLGLSNASGMFDISGTMWMVTLAFVYGLKSLWLPWLWPVFNQIFLMMYLAVWLRRSNVTTGAEWMRTRFGTKQDSDWSQWIIVVFALLSCLGFMAYGFIGLGKFVEIFVPWQVVQPYVPFDLPGEYVPHFYGIIFTSVAVVYAILGGMRSIVIADVLQYIIMTVAAFAVAIIAINKLGGQTLNVPQGWYNPFFGKEMGLNWTGIIEEVNTKIKNDGFEPFSIFFTLMLVKGILASMAGPTPNYDMQKLLSARSPGDAAKVSGLVSVILLPTRYLMVIGFAVLGLLYFDQLNLQSAHGIVDFEKILPATIHEFVPAGLMGLLLAGMLAAFIGTFAGTLNAAQAYIVNDIYLKYINKDAQSKKTTVIAYLSGIIVVVISIVMGFFAENVNSILQWIVGALYGGYIAANVLKWHWWRFNGTGFFAGMLAGVISALIFPKLFPGTVDLYYWPLLFLISLIASVVGTCLGKPADMETLKSFYATVRPWGFWKPVHDKVLLDHPDFKANKKFKRDMLNVLLGIVGQCCLTLLPMYLVLSMNFPLIITILLLGVIVLILKRTWWNKLED